MRMISQSRQVGFGRMLGLLVTRVRVLERLDRHRRRLQGRVHQWKVRGRM